ncbi:hypothetical protein D6817_01160, partial [Candidatus Pacearchaeota archaeon]
MEKRLSYMPFQKYTYKKGKRYGPYWYENKRVGNKVVSVYLGKELPESFRERASDSAGAPPSAPKPSATSGASSNNGKRFPRKQNSRFLLVVLLAFLLGFASYILLTQVSSPTARAIVEIEPARSGETLAGNFVLQ